MFYPDPRRNFGSTSLMFFRIHVSSLSSQEGVHPKNNEEDVEYEEEPEPDSEDESLEDEESVEEGEEEDGKEEDSEEEEEEEGGKEVLGRRGLSLTRC